jgi:hypothetical protein
MTEGNEGRQRDRRLEALLEPTANLPSYRFEEPAPPVRRDTVEQTKTLELDPDQELLHWRDVIKARQEAREANGVKGPVLTPNEFRRYSELLRIKLDADIVLSRAQEAKNRHTQALARANAEHAATAAALPPLRSRTPLEKTRAAHAEDDYAWAASIEERNPANVPLSQRAPTYTKKDEPIGYKVRPKLSTGEARRPDYQANVGVSPEDMQPAPLDSNILEAARAKKQAVGTQVAAQLPRNKFTKPPKREPLGRRILSWFRNLD